MTGHYFDDLGNLLEVMNKNELTQLYSSIFEENPPQYKTLGALRDEISRKIKGSYRHSFNIFGDEHEPDWRSICLDLCKYSEIQGDLEKLTTHGIEIAFILYTISKNKERLRNPYEAEKFYNGLKQDLLNGVKNGEVPKEVYNDFVSSVNPNNIVDFLTDLTRIGEKVGPLYRLYKLSSTSKAFSNISFFGGLINAGAGYTAVGSILGYNVLQTLTLKYMFQYFGFWTAVKGALGIGGAGMAMSIAGALPTILAVAYGAYGIYELYKLGDTNWEKISKAVFCVGFIRDVLIYQGRYSGI